MEKEELKNTQVMIQMEELRSAVSEIEKGVSSLKGRLESVLRNDSLASNKEESEEKEMILVPLANNLRETVSRINNSNNDITAILRELEL